MYKSLWTYLHRFGSPQYFYTIAGKLIPWCAVLSALLVSYGLIGGLIIAPPDFQQGDGFRIIYIHVPAASLSLMIYVYMAFMAAVSLIWKIKLADVLIKVSAPIGASFTFLALFTGSIWGKPMWGTWWVWDARLTSELILLFLYFGFIALQSAIPDRTTAAKAGAILLIVGVVDIPIIHFSVVWWNTLHQGASISFFQKPTIVPLMLYPLLAMMAAFAFFFATMMLIRARTEIISRERKTQWVKTEVMNHANRD